MKASTGAAVMKLQDEMMRLEERNKSLVEELDKLLRMRSFVIEQINNLPTGTEGARDLYMGLRSAVLGMEKRMFTKSHYEALAKILREARIANMSTGSAEREAQINDFVGALVKHFKDDNPRFKDLLFIAACSNHAPDAE